MYKTPNNLSSEKVNGGQRIELQRGVVTGQHSTLVEGEWLTRGRGMPSTVKARDKIATLMPLDGENCNLDGAQTEGWVFHYLDTQPFRDGMSRNGREGLGWPAQRFNALHPPLIDRTSQSLLTEGLSYQARAQPLHRPNHQRKISPKKHINRRRLFERTNYGCHILGPCLPTSKRPSTAAMNESEFYPSYLPSTSTLQQPCPVEQIVARAPKKQASEPPTETHWVKQKRRMAGTSTSMACKHTQKNKRYLEISN